MVCGAWPKIMIQNSTYYLRGHSTRRACFATYRQYLALQSWSLQRQMQFWHLAHLCSSAFSQTGAKKVIVTPQHLEIINGSLTFTSVTKSQEKRARTSTGALSDRDSVSHSARTLLQQPAAAGCVIRSTDSRLREGC